MLHLLDEALEDFVRAEIDLSRADVDLAFDAPDDEWSATVTKPTVNLFLWDIRRTFDESDTGREQVEVDGKAYWRQRPPRVDFRYLCTAWTREIVDEHRLLGSLLATFLGHREMPMSYLKGVLAEMQPGPMMKVARHDAKDFAEFWSALEGQLKPGLDLVITATVDPRILLPAGEPTSEVGFSTSDSRDPDRVSQRNRVGGKISDPDAVGAVVRSPRGSTIVAEDGRFLIPAEPGDEIVVETAAEVVLMVGEDGHLST